MSFANRAAQQGEQAARQGPIPDGQNGEERLAHDPASRRRRIQLAALALALLCYTTLGWAVSLFQSGRIPPTDLTTASVALTPLGDLLRNGAPALVYAVAALILLSNLTRLYRRSPHAILPPLLGIALLWMTMAVSTGSPATGLNFLTLISLIAITVWSIEVRPGDLVVLGRIGAVIAVISLVMAATTDLAWTDQTEDGKALIGDAVLAGFFPQMNPLGMSMAITLPFTLMFRRRVTQISGFAAIALTLLLASSRTAVIATGIALAVGLVMRFIPRKSTALAGYIISVIIVIVSIIVPARSDDTAFTSRGAVWRASLDLIPERPIWGFGPGVYGLDGEVSKIVSGAYWHGHNTVITFATIGGVLALVALALFLLPSIHAALVMAQVGTVLPFMGVATILALGIAEVPIRPSEYDGVAWVSWLCLFAISSSLLRARDHITEDRTVEGSLPSHPRLVAR